MSSAKLAVACVLAAAALSACGSSARPEAGSAAARSGNVGRGKIDDPRASHYQCLLAHHVPVVEVGGSGLQVGTPGTGPSVSFESTPGGAQWLQISGQAQSAEVIGNALLYPNQGSDGELRTIEDCLAQGVVG